MLEITSTGQACGAVVRGVNFCDDVSTETLKTIRVAWLKHHVLTFPSQKLNNNDLVRFAEYFGPIGDDPYFAPIDGHDRIAAVRREADETAPLFAEVWHSDWSFMNTPPAATCLYGLNIPLVGGDTLFANEHKAWEEMPESLRQKFLGKMACHSAKRAYSKEGRYSEDTYKGSMSIRPSDTALASQNHSLIRPHPETGRLGVFGGSYIYDLEETTKDEAGELLVELREWLDRPEFVYRHKWENDMLVLWDNRCVLHKATGGYEGHARLLYRLTIADDPKYYN